MSILKQNQETYILFICSPSLGVLDSWMSILKVLKNKLSNVHFVFIASNVGVIDQIELNSNLLKSAREIFDSVIFRADSGAWLGVKTFQDAEKLNTRSKIKVFHYGLRLMNRFKFKILGKFINFSYKAIISNVFSNNLYSISSLRDLKYVTLFDICELGKPYNKELYNIISNTPNFSILHGTGITGIQTNQVYKVKKDMPKIDVKNTTAYIFSEKEISFYEDAYGLTRKQIKVYGIPKHQKEWIKELTSKSNISESRYIFVISRPTNEWLTIERRRKFLEMIKNIAIKYQLKIFIKLHPKEAKGSLTKGNLVKKIFNSGSDSIDWDYSNIHPFTLGKNCEFAVSFYSGVAVDLLPLGVPTIELSNFTGIEQEDNEYSLRNSRGEAVREYRYLNLVLGASSYEEFDRHVIEIMNNKEKVVRSLQANYLKLFPVIENVNTLIAEEIENTIFKH
jgi:hypothetical protein